MVWWVSGKGEGEGRTGRGSGRELAESKEEGGRALHGLHKSGVTLAETTMENHESFEDDLGGCEPKKA